MTSGTTDTIAGAIFAAKKLNPETLACFEALVTRSVEHNSSAFPQSLVTAGRVGQLVNMFNNSSRGKQGDLMRRNPRSARNFIKFAKKLGDEFKSDEGMKERVNKAGVPQLVMQLMGEHGHDEETMRIGGEALSVLLNPRDAALAALASLEEMVPGLTAESANATMPKISLQNRMVSNLTTIPGVLDEHTIAKALKVYGQLLPKLQGLPQSKMRDELISDVIGAMTSMLTNENFATDPQALAMVLNALDTQCGEGNVVNSMEPLLSLANAGQFSALSLVAKHNGITALLKAADDAERRGDNESATKLRGIVDGLLEAMTSGMDWLKRQMIRTRLRLYTPKFQHLKFSRIYRPKHLCF